MYNPYKPFYMNLFQIVLDLFRRPAQESTQITKAIQTGQEKTYIHDFIRTFGRLEVYNEFENSGEKLIIIPRQFHLATHNMCMNTEREVLGALVCKKFPNGNLMIESIITLGYGKPYNVSYDQNKISALEKLKQKHPEFCIIEFHCHTETTGESFYDNFSSGDLKALAYQISTNNNYCHVLFTPTHVCTCGLNKPKFVASEIKGTEDDKLFSRYMEIHEEFEALCV